MDETLTTAKQGPNRINTNLGALQAFTRSPTHHPLTRSLHRHHTNHAWQN